MELAHVRYFLALRKEGSFTRAARRCGVAQPSLSNAIKSLEVELGARLFDRHSSGATLTEFGATVEPYFLAVARYVERIKCAPRPIARLQQDRLISHRSDGRHGAVDGQMPRAVESKMLRF